MKLEASMQRVVAAVSTTRGPAASRMLIAGGLLLLLAIMGMGCGSDDGSHAAAATPTPTPLPVIAGQENLFGSTAQGSGALTIKPLPLIPAYFNFCLASSDPNCVGGTLVYVGNDPGFKEADDMEADPGHSLYALPDGVAVTLQVMAIDPMLSLVFDAGTLNAKDQALLLGTTPGIHADLQWQLSLPAGQPVVGHHVTLKLTTTTSGFTDSVEFTETVEASTGTAPAGD